MWNLLRSRDWPLKEIWENGRSARELQPPLNVTKARFTFVVAGGDYFQIWARPVPTAGRHEKVCLHSTLHPPPPLPLLLLLYRRASALGRFPLSFFREGTKEGPRVTLRDTRITLRPYNTSRLTITGLNEPSYVTESRATCKVVKSRDETLLSDADPLPSARRDIARIPRRGEVEKRLKSGRTRREVEFSHALYLYLTFDRKQSLLTSLIVFHVD